MAAMKTIKFLDKELPVKLEWLRSFLAVAESGGFTRAAKQLRLSQPAISTHIKELERNLFERLGLAPPPPDDKPSAHESPRVS